MANNRAPSERLLALMLLHSRNSNCASVQELGTLEIMKNSKPSHNLQNRIVDLMAHASRYSFKGISRLAADAGVSKSSVSRLLRGKSSPSYVLVCRIVTALERALGQRFDPRDLIYEAGAYFTPFVCSLVACPGCLPAAAYDETGGLKPSYRGVKPGQWRSSALIARETGLTPVEELK